MDSLFEYANAEYKVYTEVISCDDKELCVAQYIGNHEGDEQSKMCIISDKGFIDLYKLKGGEAVLHGLNRKEFIRLSKYIAKQEETAKIYQKKGKTKEAQSILSSSGVPEFWIKELTDWFINNGFDIPVDEVKELAKYEEYEMEFNKFYNDRNADPKEVKAVLNDGNHWSNPSKYLSDAKKKLGIKTGELKKHPGFGWIDPKGTAKD